MKKVFFSLFLTGTLLIVSCNSNETTTANTSTTTKNDTVETQQQGSETTIVEDTETKAATELCACVNSYVADMSPKVRQILIDASKSANPVVVLTTELQKVKSEEEQQRLGKEFEKFANDQQLQNCSANLKKKYNLDENNKESRDKILKAAEQNKECEVLYALMKIGIQQEKLGVGSGR